MYNGYMYNVRINFNMGTFQVYFKTSWTEAIEMKDFLSHAIYLFL